MNTKAGNGTKTVVQMNENKNAKRADSGIGRESRLQELGKRYERIPHPTLRNTFILKEKNR